jgi:hypothetical protein
MFPPPLISTSGARLQDWSGLPGYSPDQKCRCRMDPTRALAEGTLDGRPWRVTEAEVCCQQSQPGESLRVPDRPPIVPAQRHDSGRTGTSRQPLIPICKQGVVGSIPIVSTLRFLVKFSGRNFR